MSFYNNYSATRRAAEKRARRARAIGYTIATVIVLTIIGFSISAYVGSTREVTVTITNEANVCRSSGNHGGQSCQYLIYTSGGTFSDSDSALSGKFNSSDIYGQLQIGHTYVLKVRGYRIPITSYYPNIIAVLRPGQ